MPRALRLARVLTASAFAATLAGCMASGTSSFLGSEDTNYARQSTAQHNNPAYSVPLDATTTGVVDARGGPGQPITLPSPYGAASYPTPGTTNGLADAAPAAIPAPYANAQTPYGAVAGGPQRPIGGLQQPAIANTGVDNFATASVVPANSRVMSGANGIGQPRSLYGLAPQTANVAAPAGQFPQGQLPAGLDANGNLAPQLDPFEAAAEQRIPAIHASFEHSQCKGGWGPKPKVINAKRVDPAHPYYMEMRLRHTPPLPIGHVYVAYGRLGPDGEPLDEKLIMLAPIGGYAGAALAAAAPMPGVLTPHYDDCRQTPIAAYRISLSATQFEKLLLRVRQAKSDKPTYHLFQYNCNHFMSDIVASVGVLPPDDLYKPSLAYFYEMMDRNEGRSVPRGSNYAAASAQAQQMQGRIR